MMALTEKNKKIMEKKYASLQKQLLILEKKLYPNKFSYRAFTHNGEPYLQFANDMVYPLELVKNIITTIKEDTLKVGTQTVGLILELPKDLLPNQKVMARSRPKRKQTPKKKGVKRKRNGKSKVHK